MTEKVSYASYTKCPNCGKEVMVAYMGQTAYCNRGCELEHKSKKRGYTDKRYE